MNLRNSTSLQSEKWTIEPWDHFIPNGLSKIKIPEKFRVLNLFDVETLYIKNHSLYIVDGIVKWSDHSGEQLSLHEFEHLHFLYVMDHPFYSEIRFFYSVPENIYKVIQNHVICNNKARKII